MSRVVIICTSVIASIVNHLHSQSLSVLMESIKNYDYYHTKVYARKALSNRKKISAAAYALAYVFYQNYQPFHNIDSADKYIHLAVLNYPHKAYITKYGTIDSSSIYTLYDSIVRMQFRKIFHNISPYVYDEFLSKHPFMSRVVRDEIKKHQYQKVIEYAQNVNKSDTTFRLITKYTGHTNMAALYQLFDKQIFDEVTAHHTAAEYLLFLRNYPKNMNREMALRSLLDIYIQQKNTGGLKEFAREFSKDKYYSEQAWKWFFAYSVKKFNNEELEKFVQEYPDFPFKQEVLAEMEMNAKILIPFADTTESVGFIDTSGRFFIPPVYDAVSPFKENISVVFKNDSAFFINKNHQRVIPVGYKDAYPFYNGYAAVFDGNKWYFINRMGVQQSDNFDWVSEISSDNNYVFKKNNLYGLCDYKGQIILSAVFEKLGDFENHRAYYTENNLYGIVMDNGKKYPAVYQWMSSFYGDVVIVKQNNLYGIVDANNEPVLDIRYDLIFHCIDDIFLVVKDKKYGYFKVSEKCFIYIPRWDYLKNMNAKNLTNNNYFKLVVQNKTFIGNKDGIALNKTPYQDIVITEDFILAKDKNKWGIVNPEKQALPLFIYTDFDVCNNHTLILQTPKNYILMDKYGNKKYQTENELTHVLKDYYYEETDDGGKIIDITGRIISSNVEKYVLFDRYVIVLKTDKTVEVVK